MQTDPSIAVLAQLRAGPSKLPARRRCLGRLGFTLGCLLLPRMGRATLAQDAQPVLAALRSGGVVMLLRHMETVPGTGDPPGFRLSDCATQRNLSSKGRADAMAFGERLRQAGVKFDRVLTSQWCRCRDSARLIAGQAEDWPAVNSFFEDRGTEPRQTAEALARLATLGPRENWLVVTHQVNISVLTGEFTTMGEAIVVRPRRDGDRVNLEKIGRWR